MINKFLKNWNAISYIPPTIATILICVIQDAWYLLGLFIPIIIIWMVILALSMLIYEYFRPKIDENLAMETMKGLNISKKEWKKFSNGDKLELYHYLLRQESLKKSIINKKIAEAQKERQSIEKQIEFNENRSDYIKKIEIEVNNEFENLTLNKRIEIINENVLEQIEAWKKNKIDLAEQEIRQKEESNRLEKDKIFKAEQEKIIKEEEHRKKEEERRYKENIEREEQIKLEEIKKQEYILEQKNRRDEEFKRRVKRDLLEKERRKSLESDAIQELIENGELSDNFSLQNIRLPIPSYIKEAVWKRDKQQCVTCGSRENLEFDHNVPVSKGGSNSINNIQILCLKCNRKKSNKIM